MRQKYPKIKFLTKFDKISPKFEILSIFVTFGSKMTKIGGLDYIFPPGRIGIVLNFGSKLPQNDSQTSQNHSEDGRFFLIISNYCHHYLYSFRYYIFFRWGVVFLLSFLFFIADLLFGADPFLLLFCVSPELEAGIFSKNILRFVSSVPQTYGACIHTYSVEFYGS